MNPAIETKLAWKILLGACIVFLALVLISVPFLTSGSELWLGIDWIAGRKLYSIDDAYRYFVGKNAFHLQSVFLWNYTLPLALLFDVAAGAMSSGSILGMRLFHAAVGAATLAVIARASLRAGCGPALALLSVLIVGLMPLFVVVSSSFYGEGLCALLLAVAFLLLIEEKYTPLAVVVGLLPLVRPEGAIYCVTFLIYFAMRRDTKRSTIVLLPGLLYVCAGLAFSPDWLSSMAWRLELRNVLNLLHEEIVAPISIERLLNPVWVGLALISPFLRKYRQWWPILVGPWILVAMQGYAMSRWVQDFELRYLFSTLPVFGVAWAFPVRSLLDATAAVQFRRRVVACAVAIGSVGVIAVHMLQSDWIRQRYVEPDATWAGVVNGQDVGQDLLRKTLWFDPNPVRAFARRIDAYLAAHEDIDTVFVANPAPLYFLDFLQGERPINLVFIPHNTDVAAYSGGYLFGYDLKQLSYRYYNFEPSPGAQALLIVHDAGRDPFHFLQRDKTGARQRVIANLQSGAFKAYRVKPSSSNSVQWVRASPTSTK